MRIEKINSLTNLGKNYLARNSVKKYSSHIYKKAKTSATKIDKKAGFMSLPLKYYLIGLALPIPFASTVGFVLGLGVACSKKIPIVIKKIKSS